MTSPSGLPMSNPEMLPCPFCGEAPTITESGFSSFGVSCINQECAARPGVDGMDISRTQKAARTEADAIAYWNRRAARSSGEASGTPESPVGQFAGLLERMATEDGPLDRDMLRRVAARMRAQEDEEIADRDSAAHHFEWHPSLASADEERARPQLNVFALVTRLAPKAKLSDLADALFEQGLEIGTIRTEPIPEPSDVR